MSVPALCSTTPSRPSPSLPVTRRLHRTMAGRRAWARKSASIGGSGGSAGAVVAAGCLRVGGAAPAATGGRLDPPTAASTAAAPVSVPSWKVASVRTRAASFSLATRTSAAYRSRSALSAPAAAARAASRLPRAGDVNPAAPCVRLPRPSACAVGDASQCGSPWLCGGATRPAGVDGGVSVVLPSSVRSSEPPGCGTAGENCNDADEADHAVPSDASMPPPPLPLPPPTTTTSGRRLRGGVATVTPASNSGAAGGGGARNGGAASTNGGGRARNGGAASTNGGGGAGEGARAGEEVTVVKTGRWSVVRAAAVSVGPDDAADARLASRAA